ncbi:MAG TPA: ATP-binding protein [Anaeromyxobacteraceae bacterium]|nr:ATP-binding protein [Anaeromyxobacteraceae bacterium]
MAELLPIVAVVTGWMGVLFLLALWAERAGRGRRLAGSALVYGLSQAVYCTTWTYYGSVGFAATHGLLFLTVYLGPTLAAVLGWSVLRKLVRIRNAHRITSLADLLSLRYERSQPMAMLATGVIAVGLLPYLALQLKTMIATMALVAGQDLSRAYPAVGRQVGPPVVALMIAFTIVFGIRRLSPTERHPGMMVALAAESVVKLLAFVAAGAFATYGLFHGFGDLFRRAAAPGAVSLPPLLGPGGNLVTLVTHLGLSASAILLLPRQFHVAVVEIHEERHVRTAMWLFPAYLLAINVFVLPLALAGLLLGHPASLADAFVLTLPHEAGRPLLSWLVFLGGFSAGTGMVVVETMALSTMISNHLFLPMIGAWPALRGLRRNLLGARWVAAALVICAAFGYERAFGRQEGLASIGLTSFAAVLQLAPPVLFGLYWRRASRAGAMAGLAAGFLVWIYTLLVPLLAEAGWLPVGVLARGPGGIAALRPEALLGLGGLDRLSHAVIWSLLVNVGLVIFGSLLFPASAEEESRAGRVVDALVSAPSPVAAEQEARALSGVAGKRARVARLFAQYHDDVSARRLAEECLRAVGAVGEQLSVLQLAALESAVETELGSSIGAAAAHAAVKEAALLEPEEARQISSVYAEILASLRLSPAELRRKIDYHRERERLLAREVDEERYLASVSGKLAASLELEALAPVVCGLGVPRLADAAVLWLAASEGRPPRGWLVRSRDEAADETAAALAEPAGWGTIHSVASALRAGRPVVSRPGTGAAWPAPLGELGQRGAVVTFPLVAHARTLGTLSLFAAAARQPPLLEELSLAEELARRSAMALENAGLFRSAREAVRARDEFLAIASHELKTPLTPLRLSVQLLQRAVARGDADRLAPERQEELIQRIGRQIQRLVGWFDNLLDVSVITGGRLRLTLEPFDLAEAVREVVERHAAELCEAGCSVTLRDPGAVLGRWDRMRIEQVFTNLLTNAAKYAPGRPVEVEVSADEGSARLLVRDRGPGIAAADQERIFRAFERATSYLKVSGFGLGLFIVHQIVAAHGGSVALTSVPGEGTTFTVALPRRLEALRAAGSPAP